MFKTHANATIDTNGSCLQGHITAKFKELVSLFGKPLEGDSFKTDAYWALKFDDGTIATIYNYKNGVNYCGEDGLPVDKITDWHVGGAVSDAVNKVQIALDLFRDGSFKPKGKPAKKDGENPFDDMDRARSELLASVAAHHGKNFASVVEILHMTHRLMDVVNMLISMIGKERPTELVAAGFAHEGAAQLAAQIVYVASKMGGVDAKPSAAKEIIAWADRLSSAEGTAAEPFIREMTGERKGK